MFDLLGSEMPLAVKFFIAFAVVLALIGLTAWLVRRFGSNRLGAARGRQPRLAVIDAAPVDGRRRLVLIRRDNIEHLLMIGGPTDLVVEPNIVRAVGAREVTREAAGRMTPERRAARAVRRGRLAVAAGERAGADHADQRAASLPFQRHRRAVAAAGTRRARAPRRPISTASPANCPRASIRPISALRSCAPSRAWEPRCRASRRPRRRTITTSRRWRNSSKRRCAARRSREGRPPVTDPLGAPRRASRRSRRAACCASRRCATSRS